MAKTISSETTPTHDEIAAQAYEIYLREGAVPGRDLEHWLQAEAELRARNGNGFANGDGHTNDASRSISHPLNTNTVEGPMASIAAANRNARGKTPRPARKR